MSKDVRNFSRIEIAGIIALILAILGSVIVYVVTLAKLPFAQESADFGTFGDYVGGFVGTLVGLISIIFLYRTYKIQIDISSKQELKQQSQQFESAFFALLLQQRDILQNIKGDFINNDGTHRVEAGPKFMNILREELAMRLLELSYEPDLLVPEKINVLKVRVHSLYQDLFNIHVEQLGHYFRHLYHLIKFIDSHCDTNAKSYVDIVQAQMTTDELYLTAINGISHFGRKRFLPLLGKYKFFENLMIEDADVGNDLINIFYPYTKRKNVVMQSKNIIFIGGIHAVGKSTFTNHARKIAPNIELLSCSALLNWENPEDKEVEDVMSNQERLLSALNNVLDIDKPYFIDGHFCLLDQSHNIVPVDFAVIKSMNPRKVILLTERVEVIHDRLLKRDGKDYDLALLSEMAAEEQELAEKFSEQYDVPLIILQPGEYNKIDAFVKEFGEEYLN